MSKERETRKRNEARMKIGENALRAFALGFANGQTLNSADEGSRWVGDGSTSRAMEAAQKSDPAAYNAGMIAGGATSIPALALGGAFMVARGAKAARALKAGDVATYQDEMADLKKMGGLVGAAHGGFAGAAGFEAGPMRVEDRLVGGTAGAGAGYATARLTPFVVENAPVVFGGRALNAPYELAPPKGMTPENMLRGALLEGEALARASGAPPRASRYASGDMVTLRQAARTNPYAADLLSRAQRGPVGQARQADIDTKANLLERLAAVDVAGARRAGITAPEPSGPPSAPGYRMDRWADAPFDDPYMMPAAYGAMANVDPATRSTVGARVAQRLRTEAPITSPGALSAYLNQPAMAQARTLFKLNVPPAGKAAPATRAKQRALKREQVKALRAAKPQPLTKASDPYGKAGATLNARVDEMDVPFQQSEGRISDALARFVLDNADVPQNVYMARPPEAAWAAAQKRPGFRKLSDSPPTLFSEQLAGAAAMPVEYGAVKGLEELLLALGIERPQPVARDPSLAPVESQQDRLARMLAQGGAQ